MSPVKLLPVMPQVAAVIVWPALSVTLWFTVLWGWADWLPLRRRVGGHGAPPGRRAGARQRLELIDLKDRVKRLEAIADGME